MRTPENMGRAGEPDLWAAALRALAALGETEAGEAGAPGGDAARDEPEEDGADPEPPADD